MNRSLLVLGIGLALLGGASVLLPRVVDWRAFRPEIAAAVQRLSGLHVEYVGDVQARLLPTPELRLDDVALTGLDVRVRAEAMRFGFSPGALLLGNPALTRVMLVAPRVELATAVGDDGGVAAGRAALRLLGAAAGLRRLEVERAELRVPALLSGPLPLRLEAGTERAGGPGQFRLTVEDGPELTLAGRFGTFDAAAGGRMDLTLVSVGGTVRFEGRLRAAGPGLGGRVVADLADPSALAVPLGVDPAVLPSARAVGTARVDWTPDALRVEAIDATVAAAAVTGTLRLTRAASGRRLETELAVDRLPLAVGRVLRLPPAWLSGAAGLVVGELGPPEAAFGQLRLDVAFLGDGRVAIERARGTVPGGGTFAFVGTAEPDEAGRPRLHGALELVGDDMAALSRALGVEPWLPSGAPAHGVDLAAEIGWTPGALTLGDANLQVAGARGTGRIGLRGGERPAFDATLQVARLDLDEPFWRSVAEAARARSGGVDGRFDLTVDTLQLAGLVGRDARLRGRLAEGALDLDEIAVAALGPLSGRGEGRIRVDPPPGFDLAFAGQIADTARLLRHFELPAPPVVQRLDGPVAVQGRLGGSLRAPRLVLEARAGDLVLRAEGDAADDGDGLRGGAAFSLRHPALADLLEQLGTAGVLAADLEGPVEAAGHVDYGRDAAQLVLDARLGPTTLAVDLGLDGGGARPRVSLRAQGDRLPEELVRAVAGLAREQTGAPPRTAIRPGAWPDTPLDLGALQRFDGRLDVTIGETALAGEPIRDLTLVATLARGALALDRLQTEALDGRVRGFGRLAERDGLPTLELELELEDVNARTLFGLSPVGVRPEGRLDLETELAARGSSMRDLVGTLAGDAALRLRDGALPGPDLSALERALTAPDATRAGRVGDALRDGWTALDEMAGPLRIDAGIVRAEDLTLDLAGGEGTLTGSADLTAWTLDLLLGLRLDAAPALPPIELHVTGPIDDPETVAASSAALAALERIAPAAVDAAP